MTPACVALDHAGVRYSVHPYEHDPAADSYGLEAVDALGVEADLVFKTLMAELDTGELVVAIVPVAEMLNLKLLAGVFATKRAMMADVRIAERSSGYVAGGISPLGQRTSKRTALDDSANVCERIFISGGRRGLDIGVDPNDLIPLLDAHVAPLTR